MKYDTLSIGLSRHLNSCCMRMVSKKFSGESPGVGFGVLGLSPQWPLFFFPY